jgi:hypothetical protein
MSHQDQDACQIRYQADQLKAALQWLLVGGEWKRIALRKDCTWTPRQLVAAALMWAWSAEPTLGERFLAARRITAHLDQPQQELATSSQAFLKLLVRWTGRLLIIVQALFRQRMQEALAADWSLHGFLVFGVDGSRIDLPRTKSHEAAYSPASRRPGKRKKRSRRLRPYDAVATKKANIPQLWLTLLWHAGTGLPWDWRIGPTDSSEREHWLQMLPELPKSALIAADAGYVGYEYARAVVDSGRQLLIRVGANVRLLRKLGWVKESTDTVYWWTDRAALSLQPPLMLRLVVAHNGKHPVYLVTSVRSKRQLSDAQVIDLYRRRWGVEVFFRHLKQTFQRRKLRSASAANARVELEWSLVGLWGMSLYAQVEQARRQLPILNMSTACVLRAFRRLLRDYLHPVERGCSLRVLLGRAVRDSYVRKDKTSRDYPRKKRSDPPAGAPTLELASRSHVKLARELNSIRKGLPA